MPNPYVVKDQYKQVIVQNCRDGLPAGRKADALNRVLHADRHCDVVQRYPHKQPGARCFADSFKAFPAATQTGFEWSSCSGRPPTMHKEAFTNAYTAIYDACSWGDGV